MKNVRRQITPHRRLHAGALLISGLLCNPAAAQERPPQGPPGTVTLTRTDYDRLVDLSSRPGVRPEPAPLAAALGRADLRVRVDATMARATMTLEGEVFHAGVVKVPLISGATLLDARMANGPLPLISENNTHVALLTGPATFAATLEWASPLSLTPGRAAFALPVPPAGSVTATIEIPGERSDVRISPGLILSRGTAPGRTTIQATLNPGSLVQISWSARDVVAQPEQRDVRMLSDVKTLATIGESDVRLLSVVDVTVVQGEPGQFDIRLPNGYEMSGVSGSSVDRTEERSDAMSVFVNNPALRRHQFVISLERSHSGGSFKLETSFPTVAATQRETGEVAIAGIGTLEIGSEVVPGLRRVDVRELDRTLTAAAGTSVLAAYRYQRTAPTPPTLALNVTRFADAAVLAAVAERAIATTVVTTEGRALTEVSLWIRNRAQSFLRVSLPQGATMLSVDVAGQPAKPAEGSDGTRVPLLRPGFRPNGPYAVSFVYLHAGRPFGRKGDMQMVLPRMDVPVTIVEWELFVPQAYRADRFDGNMISAELLERCAELEQTKDMTTGAGSGVGPGSGSGRGNAGGVLAAPPVPGAIAGRVADHQGNALPGATVVLEASGQKQTAETDVNGNYVFSALPSGPITITGQFAGFKTLKRSLIFDQRPQEVDLSMQVGPITETVTVSAEAVGVAELTDLREKSAQDRFRSAQNEPSANVQNLQRLAAGVLPVRIDVPRAGTSHRFVKPLVLDEETKVSFRYRRR